MRRTNSPGVLRYKRSLNVGQTTRPYYNQQQKKRIVDFADLTDHRVKLKENEKKDKYLDFAKELKKLWDMKETVVVGALGTVTKGSVKGREDLEIRRRVETIQTIALLRSVSILRRVLEPLETCYSNSCERPLANADVRNSQGVK